MRSQLLEGLREQLAAGQLEAAVAIASNSATAMPVSDPTLVEQCLAGDEEGAAKTAEGMDGEAVYAFAKLALARKVRRLAVEWAPGLRINAVAPGPVLTGADPCRARPSRHRRPDPWVPRPHGPLG